MCFVGFSCARVYCKIRKKPWKFIVDRSSYVTAGATRMWAVSLLQCYQHVTHMVVQKLHPKTCADCCPSLASFYRTRQRNFCPWEGHAICLMLYWGEGGGLPLGAADDTVMHLAVCHQRPCYQVCCAVHALETLLLEGLLFRPLPHHTS